MHARTKQLLLTISRRVPIKSSLRPRTAEINFLRVAAATAAAAAAVTSYKLNGLNGREEVLTDCLSVSLVPSYHDASFQASTVQPVVPL